MPPPTDPKLADALAYEYPEDRLEAYLEARRLSRTDLSPPVLDELRLCAGCLEGDQRAWAVLFERYRPFLYHVALKLARDGAEADDLASHVIEVLMTSGRLASFSGRGSFRGWLRAVTVHLFLDGKRRAGRARLTALEELAPHQLPATVPEEGCERHFRRDQLESVAHRLETVLADLPDRLAGFVNLYYFQGLTLAEAAGLLRVHESTASRWNGKILARLRKNLVRFLRQEKGWTNGEIADFLERCLGYLAERLARVRKQLERIQFPCKFPKKGRPSDDERETD